MEERKDAPCEGDWCTQEVPLEARIGWKERILRGRDAAVVWYVENRLFVWRWARVGAVALMFIGAVGYAAHKAYRWAVKPLPLPVALPDKPKATAKRGSSGPVRSTPKSMPPSRPIERQYNNTRTW